MTIRSLPLIVGGSTIFSMFGRESDSTGPRGVFPDRTCGADVLEGVTVMHLFELISETEQRNVRCLIDQKRGSM